MSPTDDKLERTQRLWRAFQEVHAQDGTDTPCFSVQVTASVVARLGNGAIRHHIDVRPGPAAGGAHWHWDAVVAICDEHGASWFPHEDGIRVSP